MDRRIVKILVQPVRLAVTRGFRPQRSEIPPKQEKYQLVGILYRIISVSLLILKLSMCLRLLFFSTGPTIRRCQNPRRENNQKCKERKPNAPRREVSHFGFFRAHTYIDPEGGKRAFRNIHKFSTNSPMASKAA
jgi:hypothetical protein